MGRPVIVLSRPLPKPFLRLLEQYGEVRVGGSEPHAAVFEGTGIYVSTAVDPVPASMIERFPPGLGLNSSD